MLQPLLSGKTREEWAALKVSALSFEVPKTQVMRGDYLIEVTDLVGKGGVLEVFARAWLKGNPIGFGPDGSVEIERFRIHNPPIMVPDPIGFYVRSFLDSEGVSHEWRYREDPIEAVLQVLEHNIKVTGKEGTQITPGKVGNTTSTFYPNTTGNAPLDGYVRKDTAAGGVAWATIRGAATADGANDSDVYLRVALRGGTTSNNWREMARSITGFDTSSIPDTDTISSATYSLYDALASSFPTQYGTQRIYIDTITPASSSVIAVGDYNTASWGGSSQSDTTNSLSSFTASAAYLDWSLNATGMGNISKTGTTWFGLRMSSDFTNTEPTWANNVESAATPPAADTSGTTQDPKLVVVHAAGGGSTVTIPRRMLTGVG